jgi:hypothetical protein
MKAMTGGVGGWSAPTDEGDDEAGGEEDDLEQIKKQLAELQAQLAKMTK